MQHPPIVENHTLSLLQPQLEQRSVGLDKSRKAPGCFDTPQHFAAIGTADVDLERLERAEPSSRQQCPALSCRTRISPFDGWPRVVVMLARVTVVVRHREIQQGLEVKGIGFRNRVAVR
jgi:hypothetical protein